MNLQTKKKAKFFQLKTHYFTQYKESVEVEIFARDRIGQGQGLIYIHNSSILVIYDYDRELKKEYNLSDVQKATLIKNKNTTSTPCPLTFKEKEPPRFIESSGGQAQTKIYEYFERTMSCKRFLEYEHTVNRSRETIARFAKCSNQAHNKS